MISWSFFSRIAGLRRECYLAPLQVNRLLGHKYNFWKEYKWLHVSSVCDKDPVIKKRIEIDAASQKQDLAVLKVWEGMTVNELAEALDCNPDQVLSSLDVKHEKKIKKDSNIESLQLINKVVADFGRESVIIKNSPNKIKETPVFTRQPPPKPENLVKRPPVVAIMGHVDHGKTTLLDALRNSSIVSQEFGGITQHIGAFSVQIKSGEKITFIDTPGHAAFTTIRARGAEVTDFVVLVIAADDGVMEQTVESINIIKRAHVPMIVAVNKIDKPSALNIDDIKDRLLEEGVQVEDQGGDIQLVPISALKKINLDLLVDTILLEAEVLNLRGDPKGLVEGVVIESKVDNMGKAATVIVKRGTLKKGKILVAGTTYARVRLMLDENAQKYNEALPSAPVQIFGWKQLPAAGDEVFEVDSEKEALRIVRHREKKNMQKKQEDDQKVIEEKLKMYHQQHLEEKQKLDACAHYRDRNRLRHELMLEQTQIPKDNETKLSLIVKGDVHGTIEVLSDVLGTYCQHDECKMTVVNMSVGNISENDVELAETFSGIIYGFNVDLQPNIKELVKEKRIDVRFHNILYKFVDDLKSELNSRIPPKDTEEVLGEAEVLQHFSISVKNKKVAVAGCKCTSGQLKRDSLFKVIRGDEVIYQGKVVSMKHHKNEMKTIQKATECGLMFDSFTGTFEPGDVVVCYDMIKVPQKTSWNPGF